MSTIAKTIAFFAIPIFDFAIADRTAIFCPNGDRRSRSLMLCISYKLSISYAKIWSDIFRKKEENIVYYLNSSLTETRSSGQVFSGKSVWIVSFFENGLQGLQLKTGESCAISPGAPTASAGKFISGIFMTRNRIIVYGRERNAQMLKAIFLSPKIFWYCLKCSCILIKKCK